MPDGRVKIAIDSRDTFGAIYLTPAGVTELARALAFEYVGTSPGYLGLGESERADFARLIDLWREPLPPEGAA
jgi:hypothetical protein